MKKNLLRRNFSYATLFLFIGLCISSCVWGNNIQSFKESLHNIPLNNDYVLAYWKFDEGSGNILEDSSGHDFDGTIYGATWVTGKYGKALSFDGINDYVELKEYSQNLGINKTDDLIYSIWFKSINGGMIYGMCGTKNIPEIFIELTANGKLFFKAWTTYCGILLFSKNTYNDDKWHHATFYFNGYTSDPVVELYVDGKFDNNETEWLCKIENTHFNKVRMGRRAYNETKYFDGLLDEFKIIKYPGGNKQTPPTIIGPISGEVGEELMYTFVSEDPERDNVSYFIKWGDGEEIGWLGPYPSGEEIIEEHSWNEEGAYEIIAKSKDYWEDSFPAFFEIRIGNDIPNKPEKPTGPTEGEAGVKYTFFTRTTDPDNDSLYYNWSWGDGNYSGWLGPYLSGNVTNASYIWNESGNYNITVIAADKYGEGERSDSLEIQIVKPILNIEKINDGILRIKSIIQNNGDGDARDVYWSIDITGVIIPSNPHWEGIIENIPPGGSEKIRSGPIIGLGEIGITISAEIENMTSDTLQKNAWIFIIFILMR